MSEENNNSEPLWIDLTVDDAGALRGFYERVAGWSSDPLSMGEYDDYVMKRKGETIAGICHARGPNVDMPPVWLPYFEVDSLDASLRACADLGGTQVGSVRSHGDSMRYVVVRDPAGAHSVLFERT